MQQRREPRRRTGSAGSAGSAGGAGSAGSAGGAGAAAVEAPLPKLASGGAAGAGAARRHGGGVAAQGGEHRHVTFDEAVLAEHDLLRGTRGKIDEPDTPFHRGSFDEAAGDEDLVMMDEAAGGAPVRVVFAEGVARDFERHGVLRRDDGAVADMEDCEDDDEAELCGPPGAIDLEALRAKLDGVGSAHPFVHHDLHAVEQERDHEFAAKRKQHYNEMEVLRKWKEAHADGEDDDEDDAEEEGVGDGCDEGASANASASHVAARRR